MKKLQKSHKGNEQKMSEHWFKEAIKVSSLY